MGLCSGTADWGIVLQARWSQIWFPMESLGFFIDLSLPAALWSWGWLSHWEKWVAGMSPGGKGGRWIGKTILPLAHAAFRKPQTTMSKITVMPIIIYIVYIIWYLVLASMHHWTSRSVVRGLGSAVCAKPRLAANCLTTAMATSFPVATGNFPNTLWHSSFPFWISDVRDAHSEYIPLHSESWKQFNEYINCQIQKTKNIPTALLPQCISIKQFILNP